MLSKFNRPETRRFKVVSFQILIRLVSAWTASLSCISSIGNNLSIRSDINKPDHRYFIRISTVFPIITCKAPQISRTFAKRFFQTIQ